MSHLIASCCVAGVLLISASALAQAATGRVEPDPKEFMDRFWASTTMRGESLFFVQREEGRPPTATLLFRPERILSVRSATREVAYEEGRDYLVDRASGVMSLPPGSRIPFKTMAEMYPPADSKLPKMAHLRGDPKTCLIFSEGSFFHRLQVEVSYDHAGGLWRGPVPAFAGQTLPRTIEKLKKGRGITLAISGDSISAGANASRSTGVAPFMPPYPALVARGLEQVYGGRVDLKNFAVGGWTTDRGAKDAGRVADARPDLLIIAYGLNDCGGVPVQRFVSNLQAIMATVRQQSPEAEFILISTMLGNEEWHLLNLDRLRAYREAMKELTVGEGVVLADITGMWEEMLRRKSFHDLTGNGVNHPNDFGHRVYAATILALLVEAQGGE